MSKKVIEVKALGFPWETQDPFLFCAYHLDIYPKGNKDLGPDVSLDDRYLGQDFNKKDGFRMYHGTKIPGFPFHPHRGFETITIAKQGVVDHSDSLGSSGRFSNGDVQWMTAGKGVQHSEMFPLLNDDKKNPLEIFQVWLNLPKKDKMVAPHFKMLWSEDIPTLKKQDNNGLTTEIDIVAGIIDAHKASRPAPNSWAADESNEVAVWTIKMEANASYTIPKASSQLSRTLFFYEGIEISIDNSKIQSNHSVLLESDEDVLIKNGDAEASFLFLQGKPIGEPVIQRGPFVMNTREEISETIRDYQETQFGGWPWENADQVHDKNLGRFAKHSDGKEEIK